MLKPTILQQPLERRRPNRSLPNMLMPIQLRAHRRFGIIAMPHLHRIETDRLPDLPHRRFIPLRRDEIVPRHMRMAGVQTHPHRSASL